MKFKAYWCEEYFKFLRPDVIQNERANFAAYFRVEKLGVVKKIIRWEIFNKLFIHETINLR
jgi:hypothetical protein